ncbi:MAG: hypothetical protein M1834_002593 [Cirrosporium novae-zelandiae]|nr:MAG: hypothetical protein M1834_002593 [Cirrosporium novae-zelandiae]
MLSRKRRCFSVSQSPPLRRELKSSRVQDELLRDKDEPPLALRNTRKPSPNLVAGSRRRKATKISKPSVSPPQDRKLSRAEREILPYNNEPLFSSEGDVSFFPKKRRQSTNSRHNAIATVTPISKARKLTKEERELLPYNKEPLSIQKETTPPVIKQGERMTRNQRQLVRGGTEPQRPNYNLKQIYGKEYKLALRECQRGRKVSNESESERSIRVASSEIGSYIKSNCLLPDTKDELNQATEYAINEFEHARANGLLQESHVAAQIPKKRFERRASRTLSSNSDRLKFYARRSRAKAVGGVPKTSTYSRMMPTPDTMMEYDTIVRSIEDDDSSWEYE